VQVIEREALNKLRNHHTLRNLWTELGGA
jgi:hypothetical protein